ncbi:molybdopterin-dependent oxidoreductase [Cryptosporangium minutisporangium]|uniref:Oxidoreductase molybdopterin-binding domain-containing protein n=1 Tax=Cryptosporangium minutisporangium TaxID=113569 RepID=A0ABP6SXX0_9ACTN
MADTVSSPESHRVHSAQRSTGPTGPSMAVRRNAASAAGVVLVLAAAVHGYWAAGGRWPGWDEASLAQRVVGDTVHFPSAFATASVAALLGGAAALLLIRARLLPPVLPTGLQRLGLVLLAGALAARGVLGAITSAHALVGRGADVPYYRLDLLVYSPACLVVAALTVVALRSGRRHVDEISLARLWPRRAPGAALPPGQRLLEVFPRFSDDPRRPLPPLPATAELTIGGAVVHPLHLDLSALAGAVPRTQLTADFHCVTTWSVRDLTWSGFSFAEVWRQVIVPRCEPDPDSIGVVVRGADGVQAIIDLRDALQPDVLLADQLDGAPLSPVHGAPLRFVSPQQYGYKNIKHVSHLEVFVRTPESTFGPKEHPRARVTREERHSRLPATALRWPYRIVVPLTARLSERSTRSSTRRSAR